MTENAKPENIVDEITSIRNRLKEIDTKLKERQLRGTKTAFYIQNALFFTDDACYAAKEETLE